MLENISRWPTAETFFKVRGFTSWEKCRVGKYIELSFFFNEMQDFFFKTLMAFPGKGKSILVIYRMWKKCFFSLMRIKICIRWRHKLIQREIVVLLYGIQKVLDRERTPLHVLRSQSIYISSGTLIIFFYLDWVRSPLLGIRKKA